MSFMEAVSEIEDDTAAWSYVLERFRTGGIQYMKFRRDYDEKGLLLEAMCGDGYWRTGRGDTPELTIRELAKKLQQEFPKDWSK